jgi:hypothetical protein
VVNESYIDYANILYFKGIRLKGKIIISPTWINFMNYHRNVEIIQNEWQNIQKGPYFVEYGDVIFTKNARKKKLWI